jgi:MarR family 2-MHQ and catechol resistance regulon transcriptional repressor
MVHVPADIVARFWSYLMLLKSTPARYYGLNPVQFLALLLIGETTLGLSIKQLRERMAVPGSSLSFTLDSLERKRLIVRRRSKEDRRQWFLYLAPEGKRLHSEMLTKESEALVPALEGFTDFEREAFLKIAGEISRRESGRYE